jgi:hypothetical protein
MTTDSLSTARQTLLERLIRYERSAVDETIAPEDTMFQAARRAHYFAAGRDAVNVVAQAMFKVGLGTTSMPCATQRAATLASWMIGPRTRGRQANLDLLAQVLPGQGLERIRSVGVADARVRQDVAAGGPRLGEHPSQALLHDRPQRTANPLGMPLGAFEQRILDVQGHLH